MNKNINNYNEKEVKNKLKNFKEDADYSVLREGEKKIYNFHNNFLRDIMGDNWTTVYEAAENWDSDNYNHHREAAEYVSNNVGESGNRGKIIYRYEHKINKDASGYKEWSWGENFFRDGLKHTWTLRSWPNSNFGNNFFAPVDEAENHRRNLEEFRHERIKCEKDIEYLQQFICEKADCDAKEKIAKLQIRIDEIDNKICYHEDWLAENDNVLHGPDWISCPVCDKTFNKNAEVWGVQDDSGGFQSTCCHKCAENFQGKEGGRIIKSGLDEYFGRDPQQKGRIGRNEKGGLVIGSKGSFITDEGDNNQSDLRKENQELKKQLDEVKSQLKEVLEELKKLRNSSAGQNNAELDQQINYNEKLVRHGEEVPIAEIKEQVQKSQDLLKTNSFSVAPNKNNSGFGSLPYVIGGVALVGVAAIIGYYLWNGKRKNKTS